MLIEQLQYSAGRWWAALDEAERVTSPQLVLVFGDRETLEQGAYYSQLCARWPGAVVVSTSSGGDVAGAKVLEGGAVATAIQFAEATVQAVTMDLASTQESESVGAALASRLTASDLQHVLVFSEGLGVNGSALARGVSSSLPNSVTVTGGLAADGDAFRSTAVGLNGAPRSGRVVAVGLYGAALEVGSGTYGGWEPFDADRRITRSSGNVLYELDGRPALELYRELLGPLGYALPASGLLFPLKVRPFGEDGGLIRTILGVNESEGSVTFAGDVPEGWSARLVRTELDTLIDAAGLAAERCLRGRVPSGQTLVLAVSCIGRRLLLQKRTDEELQRVQQAFGPAARLAGFYSYGELAPSLTDAPCELHNQTMTITAISERPRAA